MKKIINVIGVLLIIVSSFNTDASYLSLKEFNQIKFSPEFKKQELKKFNKGLKKTDIAMCDLSLKVSCISNNTKYLIDVSTGKFGKAMKNKTFNLSFNPANFEPIEMAYLEALSDWSAKEYSSAYEKIKLHMDDFLVINGSQLYLKGNYQSESFLYDGIFSTGNGCGSPSHVTYHLIPDLRFGSACNSHDICYASYTSKSLCDSRFLADMVTIVQDLPWYDFNRPHYLALAGVYYKTVAELEAAIVAYCEGKSADCFEKVKNELVMTAAAGVDALFVLEVVVLITVTANQIV
jgi:hypothetical protein